MLYDRFYLWPSTFKFKVKKVNFLPHGFQITGAFGIMKILPQWAHDAIMSSWRQNDIATLSWHHNDIILHEIPTQITHGSIHKIKSWVMVRSQNNDYYHEQADTCRMWLNNNYENHHSCDDENYHGSNTVSWFLCHSQWAHPEVELLNMWCLVLTQSRLNHCDALEIQSANCELPVNIPWPYFFNMGRLNNNIPSGKA